MYSVEYRPYVGQPRMYRAATVNPIGGVLVMYSAINANYPSEGADRIMISLGAGDLVFIDDVPAEETSDSVSGEPAETEEPTNARGNGGERRLIAA